MSARAAAALALAFASACPSPVSVTREMAGGYSEDDTPVVLRLAYTTTDPSAPYFNDPAATEWTLTVVVDGEDAAVLGEPFAFQGQLAASPLFFAAARSALVTRFASDVVVVNTATGAWMLVRPEPDALRPALGDEGAVDPPLLDAHPSPDGATIAAFYTLAFEGPGGVLDLRFRHAIAFFATSTGALLRVHDVAWPDDRVDPHLAPAAPIPHRWRMLWTRDGSGVVVLDRGGARFFPVDGEPAERTLVPARAIPTTSGPVSSDGRYFVAPDDGDGDGATLTERVVDDYVDFTALGEIAVADADYALPPYED